mmetsp:Transcript_59323/g.94176  ORF Transcript_59323/g.94176 Transcript_59323/m.94176 type:complete len:652 (-) Transcript_59323:80-2035(-)
MVADSENVTRAETPGDVEVVAEDFEGFDVEDTKSAEVSRSQPVDEAKTTKLATSDEEQSSQISHQKKEVVTEEDASAPKASDIFMLARQQNFAVATKLLENYPHLWVARDEDGHSLLHWASLVGSAEFVEKALENHLEVDALANNLQTPLMWAALRGHCRAARVLMEHKADLQLKDSLGATPLIIAVQHAMYQTMLLLMARGNKAALIADKDKNGCTSAHWAAYKGDLTALRFLAYFGADLCALDNAGMQPLHRAAFGSQSSVIEFLLENKADPLLRNGDGKTCLDIAESQADISMLSTLKRLMNKGKSTDANETPAEGKQKKLLAKRIQEAMQDNRAHILFPIFWVVCVSLAMVQYLTDLRPIAWSIAPNASMCFEFGVPLSLLVFAITAFGDPGKVPARPIGNSGVEEIMRKLNSPSQEAVDMSRLCTTTWVIKGLRSKYCVQTRAVVDEFDHYCIWLNCAIGKSNHRPFIILAVCECFTQCCHIYLMWSLTGTLVTAQGLGSWLYGVIIGYPLLALMFVLHCFTAPWVCMLFLHQTRLVLMNLTTNEMMNAGRYEHFWTLVEVGPNRMQRIYRNPFNKGGWLRNFLDFWWFRNRSLQGPPEVLNKVIPQNHGHSHGSNSQSHGHSCQNGSCPHHGHDHGRPSHGHGAV